MLKLENIGQDEWCFHSSCPDDLQMSFYDAMEEMDAGHLVAAEARLRQIIQQFPEHIDAWHHLSLILTQTGDDILAWACTREAARLGLDVIPKAFSWNTSRLEWGFLENRPFMRAYFSLGLHLREREDVHAAKEVFSRLLAVNPNDNQGARYLLLECDLTLQDWKGVLRVVDEYRDDSAPDIEYAHALALLGLGKENKARQCLQKAICYHPKVARELLKSRHVRPKSSHPGYITCGGADEAFAYWERNKAHWAKDTRAYALLKELNAR